MKRVRTTDISTVLQGSIILLRREIFDWHSDNCYDEKTANFRPLEILNNRFSSYKMVWGIPNGVILYRTSPGLLRSARIPGSFSVENIHMNFFSSDFVKKSLRDDFCPKKFRLCPLIGKFSLEVTGSFWNFESDPLLA